MKTFTVASLTLTALTVVSLAHANGVPQTTVKYGDLDLNSAKGAAVLYRRIEHAARSVCDPVTDTESLALKTRYGACIAHAISEAVDKVDRVALSQYAATKGQATGLKLAAR